MFREMRRKNKALGSDAAKHLLATERRGVLSVLGDDGYPYGVPINYIYSEADGKIYFHGSRVGHKADAIKRCDKVCFTVYGNESVKDEAWAPYMQSVIIFGRCSTIDDRNAAMDAVRKLAGKYYPDTKLIDEEIAKSGKAVQLFEITIEHLSGKEIQER